ncbi:MAG: NADH-quinone oxidoreductase subunit D [Coriobacteriia bacterium]|nr:NADH-quinone oxidoreductase subunit D [Coriobacteriia bacterium]
MQQLDTTVAKSVLERAGIESSVESAEGSLSVCRVAATDVRAALVALRDSDVSVRALVDLFGIDTGEAVDAVYHVRSLTRDEDLIIKAAHDYDGVLTSIWDLFPGALMPERETAELFGLSLAGHPNPKRLLTTDGCAPLLRKSFEVRGADEVRDRASQHIEVTAVDKPTGSIAAPNDPGMLGECVVVLPRIPSGVPTKSSENLILNMGPQHPSTHGVLRLILELDGETIVSGESVIGYLHRGIEKLAESRRYSAVGTLMDRGDYVAGIHGELAFALATEAAAEIEVPRRANYLRCLLGELNRIASHIVWYGPMGLDAGAMGQFLYTFRDREALLDILEDITGQRMMFNYVRPGGVVADITTTAEAKIRRFLDDFAIHVVENEEILMDNEIFQMRTKGVGVIDREAALAFGLTGPALRGSGIAWDIRRDRPYAAYDELEFDVPVAEAGDIYARCQVRIEEMKQSAAIVRQCLDGMPEGEHTAKVARVLRPKAAEAYAAVESPRGELGVHLVTDGTDTPYRMRYRPPALYALQAGEAFLPGVLLADSVVLMGSLDLILGEVDR